MTMTVLYIAFNIRPVLYWFAFTDKIVLCKLKWKVLYLQAETSFPRKGDREPGNSPNSKLCGIPKKTLGFVRLQNIASVWCLSERYSL